LIDLHCHLLPGADDGAKNLDTSLEMARLAVADGITVTACTPHILPSVYDNEGPAIKAAVALLQQALAIAGIPLRLISGADVHIYPNLVPGLRESRIATLNTSRYFLLELPHHVVPPHLEGHIFGLQTAGYVPILTHPERLSWIDSHYSLIRRIVNNGVWLQLTAGSLTGRFGRRPRYWAERMLDEGLCHVLATDAHNTTTRAPFLAEGRAAAAKRLGEHEATNLVSTRAQGVIDDVSPAQLSVPPGLNSQIAESSSKWRRILTRIRGGEGAS